MKCRVTIPLSTGETCQTWGLLPIGETKIIDGIYNPETKLLQLYIDSVSQQPTEMTVIEKGREVRQTRKVDMYYRHFLREEDIPFFLENYVENNFEMEAILPTKIVTDV